MKMRSGKDAILSVFALLVLISPLVYSVLKSSAAMTQTACASGRSSAKLTGWMLNDKMPVGRAVYDESTQRLEISVDSVALADGLRLAVHIGDERIGELEGIMSGSARGSITRSLKEGDRVRIFNGDRPIVSGNLECDMVVSQTATPTVSPTASPTASPTVTPEALPTVSPTPTPPVGPTVTPSPAV